MPLQTISPQAAQAAIDHAAGRLILCEPDKVAGWVVYLLECLDSNTWEGYDFRGTLLAVQDAITTRLEEGRW